MIEDVNCEALDKKGRLTAVKKTFVVVLVALLAVMFCATAWAEEGTKEVKMPLKPDTLKWAEAHFTYVGTAKCKMCHMFEYKSWDSTAHAKAWASLKEEDQKNETCVGCHSVGKDKDGKLITDVGCEACHGPGSEYMAMKTMKDKDASIAAGLMLPDEQWCRRCHNPNNPNHKTFDYAEAAKTGLHARKEEKK